MPQRLLHKPQVLKVSHRGSHSTQNWIFHKSLKPHKEVLGRAHKGLEMSIIHGWHQHPLKEGGGKLLYLSLKICHWELASKN
jgi:hypothetical protein